MLSPSLHPWVALVLLAALPQGWALDPPMAEISVDNGGPWGDWGEAEFCPKGSYATGFQLKVEPPQGVFRDDTALNGIRLLCNERGTVTSSEGLWGEWSPPQACGRSARLVSFRLRVEAPRGLRDDTAANSLDFACSDGTVLHGQGGERGAWGNWSSTCGPSRGICGMQTLVEAPQRSRDDTGLNSVIFFCCY